MNKFIPFFLTLFFTISVQAQEVATFFSKTDQFLETHIKNGAVAYGKIHSDSTQLNEILNLAATTLRERLNKVTDFIPNCHSLTN